MKTYNIILLFHHELPQMLMCHRLRNPYKGKYNCVGGKVEPGEAPLAAAYRELFEETGVTSEDVTLHPIMTTVYHQTDIELQVFAGKLRRAVEIHGDENPLLWMSLEENYFDLEKFAGEGNIGHMLADINYCRSLIFD